MTLEDRTIDALHRVVAGLGDRGEARPGQDEMARAVARAISGNRNLVVEAGTGTGKSMAYLVPTIVSGGRTVVATATKALQDQLVAKDLPHLADHLGRPLSVALLKGRANYACRQRVAEVSARLDGRQLGLAGITTAEDRVPPEELEALLRWVATSPSGDRSDLDVEPSAAGWAALSVSSRECPGAARCPQGAECFAEEARRRAEDADVVVVNLHLYALHLATGGVLLPHHDVAVIDEAHQFEQVFSSAAGVELGGGRLRGAAQVVGAVLADEAVVDALRTAGAGLETALAPRSGRRLRHGLPSDVAERFVDARHAATEALTALRGLEDVTLGEAAARRTRAMQVLTALTEDIDRAQDPPPHEVCWVEGGSAAPVLRLAPLQVASSLGPLWDARTVVLTSATVPPGLGEALGLPTAETDEVRVASPFDYASQALLYCAAHLPDPRREEFDAAARAEIEALILAAGGRTLALFTSRRAMREAVEHLRPRLPWPVLGQDDLPKPALLARFADDEATSLVATMGFWQGVDIPGDALVLVTIDRLPFPRPDEPLLGARREQAREKAFATIDLPHAATMLAQGVGRLIRSGRDQGVVAVLDPRLATARYRWELVNALPPMARTRHRRDAEARLRTIRDAPSTD